MLIIHVINHVLTTAGIEGFSKNIFQFEEPRLHQYLSGEYTCMNIDTVV